MSRKLREFKRDSVQNNGVLRFNSYGATFGGNLKDASKTWNGRNNKIFYWDAKESSKLFKYNNKYPRWYAHG